RPAGAPERAEPADAPDAAPAASLSSGPVPLPDPFDQDISPWLLRRLDLAAGIAMQIKADVAQILRDPAMLPASPSQQPRSA
ncbi:MAG: hypothetical protein J7603_21965, partial [Pseudacidovorax sp.]|nr:hypothetical protein [Pseudacidovorax sp.]